MNERTAHFTVIFRPGTPGHQAIAEIDQAAQRNVREQDGLLQPHRVGSAGTFFENRALSHMGARSNGRAL